jgi:GNAT superfamily N-acetyltransferase
MYGPVSGSELDSIESFYRERQAPVTIDTCPLADPSLFDLLARRGYRITEFNNVLVRTIDPPVTDIDVGTRLADASEADLWARTVAEGFFERSDFMPDELTTMLLLFRMPGGMPWLAFLDSAPAGAAGMSVRNGLATLFGDATLKPYRRRGVHTNLIKMRLAYAAERGCDLVTASTLPGSQSQLNYERLGFRIIYTKLIMTRDSRE